MTDLGLKLDNSPSSDNDNSDPFHNGSLSSSSSLDNLIVVFNKTDLSDCRLTVNQNGNSETDFPVFHISCVTEEGMDQFLEQVKVKVADICADPSSLGNPSLTQARYRRHLEECVEALNRCC